MARLSPTRGLAAWRRWQAAAGPWQGWSICPALLSPELAALPTTRVGRPSRAHALASALRELLEPGGVLCLLELDPLLGVAIAALLADAAHPVLLLPRWPYAEALLPCVPLIATLLAEAQALPAATPLPNVVFVIDPDRTRPVPHRMARDRRADNRYSLSLQDLPDFKTLRSRGIRRIHHIRQTA